MYLFMSSKLQPYSLFLLTLSLLTFTSFSTTTTTTTTTTLERTDDFKRWVSWNAQNYKQTTALHNVHMNYPNSMEPHGGGGGGGGRTLDVRLAKAEAAAARYIVCQDGSGDYRSIREAIDDVPLHNTRRVILVIKPGIYREKIVIPKPMSFITLLGIGESPPTITGNDTAATKGRDGVPLKTFHSPTVAVNSDYFAAVNIRFENTAPYPENGEAGGQAVALRISGDKAAFYNCSFYGTQDTLYDHMGLHYFNNCFIQGSVDFIFGYGRSLYEHCYLNSIAKKVASLTAQKGGGFAPTESGFSFTQSTIAGSGGPVYLGRAWGPHSRVVYSYTFMDKMVIPQGWNSWRIRRPESSGVYYGEYRCSGPGANWTGRVRWAHLLTEAEAQPFLGPYYVNGDTWILGPPST